MNPMIIAVLGPILKNVLGSVLDKLPVPAGERERANQEVDKALAGSAGEIAKAQAEMASSRQAEWIADITSSSWIAQNWRPMLGLGGGFLLVWEGVLIQLLNTILFYFSSSMPVPHAPEYVMDAAMWIVLGLIGVRSAEKITAVRTVK